jgi:hypothetical protein
VGFTEADFQATHPVADVEKGLRLSWTRSDGVEGANAFSTPVAAGTVVAITFIATAGGGDASASASCTTQMHVLYVRPAGENYVLKPYGAVGSGYTSEPLELVVEGALGDVVFYLRGNSSLPIGLEAETTTALGDSQQGDASSRSDNVRLRLLGAAANAGQHTFELDARDTETDTASQVGRAPFVVDIRECDDELYNTCFEGSCVDDGSLYDGNFKCECNPGFPRGDNGLCTLPSVPPTITCPCDTQLVAGLHEERIPAPEGLTADAFSVVNGGNSTPTFSRSDGANLLSHPFTTPFAGGSPVRPQMQSMPLAAF